MKILGRDVTGPFRMGLLLARLTDQSKGRGAVAENGFPLTNDKSALVTFAPRRPFYPFINSAALRNGITNRFDEPFVLLTDSSQLL